MPLHNKHHADVQGHVMLSGEQFFAPKPMVKHLSEDQFSPFTYNKLPVTRHLAPVVSQTNIIPSALPHFPLK
jgi:hypothetical protein